MAHGPWGSLSLVFAALSVCGALGGSCDRSLCSSVADDCCAPLSIGEAATCRNGYVAQRTGNGCFGYGEGDYTCCSTSASSDDSGGSNCRSDICTDYAEDCCAPGDEPRGCSLAGYEVQDDWVGSSGWPSCVSTYGQESVYQCCSTSAGSGSSDALFVAGPSGGDYDDAVAYCSRIGASIATIYSATENELARQACGGSTC